MQVLSKIKQLDSLAGKNESNMMKTLPKYKQT